MLTSRIVSAAKTIHTPVSRSFATVAPRNVENYNDSKWKKYVELKPNQKVVMIGFGAIGQGVLAMLFRHIKMTPQQLVILSNEFTDKQRQLAASYGAQLVEYKLTKDDYLAPLQQHIKNDDFLINLSVDVSSLALMEHCQKVGALYLDTCNEPWAGGYSDPTQSASARSNYAFRESVLDFKKKHPKNGATALITHGANPGLVSHFVKQGILDIARDTNMNIGKAPTSGQDWAMLANQVGVKSIHVSERDTQASSITKSLDEFVNTWSIEGYVEEGKQPAELGWGTHEKEFPADGVRHDNGCQAAIFLDRPGALTKVRSWNPICGPFHSLLITHTEAISISDYFTQLDSNGKVAYRPTCHFAYHAAPDAHQSMMEVAGMEWKKHGKERIMVDDIVSGTDSLGVLLMGHKKNAYWLGSMLSIEQARSLVPNNNATSLQVCVGVLTGVIHALKNPRLGIVEPEEIDHKPILEVGVPYLGNFVGKYTDWKPTDNRGVLFKEDVDYSDAWQFKNFRVM